MSHSRSQFLIIIIAAFCLTGLIFLAADRAESNRNPRWSRPVMLDGVLLGYVELRPLAMENGLWSLDVYFEPLNGELGIVRENNLRWWQIAEREGREGYPRIDMQRGSTLPGSPGDDDDPAYYTLSEKLGLGGHFTPDEIFADNKYWMRDTPQPEDGVSFETWLVKQEESSITRLVGFTWGIISNKGQVASVVQPMFITKSKYDFPAIISQSGFGSHWTDHTSPTLDYQ
jgi:hypothetical protein